MKAYRLSVNLKLGLIVFAVLIAVASLAYTSYLVDRLREREQASVQIWAGASQQVVTYPSNEYARELAGLERFLSQLQAGDRLQPGVLPDSARLAAFQEAVEWARTMPPGEPLTFISSIFIDHLSVPAIVTDSAGRPQFWRNVSVPDTTTSPADTLRLMRRVREMAQVNPPIPIVLGEGDQMQKQFVYYDESAIIKELRIYPLLQFVFVALFILVGYLGFSYVRRSEQSNLWVGMAREAAHQLGTPISSLMGWVELLRMPELSSQKMEVALEEIDKDIQRLHRVANRFSDIGSLPKLDVMPLAPVVANTADYIRRRFPSQGMHVELAVEVPPELRAPINAELFEWVIENLLKNALDAMERRDGLIRIKAYDEEGTIYIDVQDNGKGIDRRQWKNIFRPGYSTKKRGWGLGLSLAKRIVEDYHGGSLTLAHSRVGHGTTFRIALPAASAT